MDMLAQNKGVFIVGIDDQGLILQQEPALSLLKQADTIFGGKRHLSYLPANLKAEQRSWSCKIKDNIKEIDTLSESKKIIVLATGDPLTYGIGATLLRDIDASKCHFLPSSNAFQLAASRLKWDLTRVETISLHGRPIETIRQFIYPHAKILILSKDKTTPSAVREYLHNEMGISEVHFHALSHMGGVKEKYIQWQMGDDCPVFDDFHTFAIEFTANVGKNWSAYAGSLPDSAFIHDGKMTKQQARISAMAHLQPFKNAVFWDVGSGCGSISIEYGLKAPFSKIFAIDHQAKRHDMLEDNMQALGFTAENIIKIAEKAPDCFASLPDPDAIFIGGGLSNISIANEAINRLSPSGRLVAHAVTLESEANLLSLYHEYGGQLTRMQFSNAEKVGPYSGWRSQMPITQWCFQK